MTTIKDVAALLARYLVPANPIIPAEIITDLGVGDGGTPMVVISAGDAARRAIYLPPHAIVEGGKVFAMRLGHRLTDPFCVIATNLQGIATVIGGASWGSTLGVGSTTSAASTDWASGMTDGTNEDGALLPLILGQVAT